MSYRLSTAVDTILSTAGVKPEPDKTQGIRDIGEPSNTGEVCRFLGMVNQLGKFIPGLAEKDTNHYPLCDLLSKKNQWVWGSAQQSAFAQFKRNLTSAPLLSLYDTKKELKFSADASLYGLGQSYRESVTSGDQ